MLVSKNSAYSVLGKWKIRSNQTCDKLIINLNELEQELLRQISTEPVMNTLSLLCESLTVSLQHDRVEIGAGGTLTKAALYQQLFAHILL